MRHELYCYWWLKLRDLNFLESPVNFSAPKNHFKNCDPLISKSWSFTMIWRYERATLLQNFMPGNVFVFKIRRKLWHPKCARKVPGKCLFIIFYNILHLVKYCKCCCVNRRAQVQQIALILRYLWMTFLFQKFLYWAVSDQISAAVLVATGVSQLT